MTQLNIEITGISFNELFSLLRHIMSYFLYHSALKIRNRHRVDTIMFTRKRQFAKPSLKMCFKSHAIPGNCLPIVSWK